MLDIQKNVLIIDTETSGTNPYLHSLLSLAVVPLLDHRISGEEWFVFEPEIVVDPRSMSIHGIELKWLKENGLDPLELCDRFEAYLESLDQDNIVLAGHNICFDIRFLKQLYHRLQRPWPSLLSHRSIDTHSLLWLYAQAGKLPQEACTSDGAFKHFSCAPPPELRHSALGDAVATKDLLLHLMQLTLV